MVFKKEIIVSNTHIRFPALAENERRLHVNWVPEFRQKLAKLAGKARKLGVELPAVTLIREEVLDVLNEDNEPTGEVAHFHVYSGERRLIRLPGWSLAATIQHTSEGNILRAVPDLVLPPSYRTDDPTCDHCGVSRRRYETFALIHEDGRFARVGRNCLADFLGRHSADTILALAGIASSEEAIFNEYEEEGYGFGGGGMKRWKPLDIAAFTVATIATHGWMSRGAARDRENATATADVVYNHLCPPPKFKRTVPSPTEEQVEEARAALAWAQSIDAESASDYLWNCRVLAGLGSWTPAELGVGCSIVAAYQREQSRLKMAEFARRLPSVHLGSEGTRFGGKGTKKAPAPAPLGALVLRTYERAGDFGLTTIVTMQTEVDAEHVADLVWFASGSVDVKAGDQVLVTGTVKRHTESKKTGRLETHLTRCTLVKVEEGS